MPAEVPSPQQQADQPPVVGTIFGQEDSAVQGHCFGSCVGRRGRAIEESVLGLLAWVAFGSWVLLRDPRRLSGLRGMTGL